MIVVEPDRSPDEGYYLNDDLSDHAIRWIRQMEIYAGFLENTDHHIGLLLYTVDELGIAGDTLTCAIIGDNGASAEGSLQGTFNEMVTLGGFGGARIR
jgi:arylsulfatase A-like enzyme